MLSSISLRGESTCALQHLAEDEADGDGDAMLRQVHTARERERERESAVARHGLDSGGERKLVGASIERQ